MSKFKKGDIVIPVAEEPAENLLFAWENMSDTPYTIYEILDNGLIVLEGYLILVEPSIIEHYK